MSELVETPWWSEYEDKPEPVPSRFQSLGEVEWSDESYQFDLTRVYVEDGTGNLFFADDIGCSCPTPFEDTTVDDLTPITRLQDWYDYVETRIVPNDPEDMYSSGTPTSSYDELEQLRRKIEEHLKK